MSTNFKLRQSTLHGIKTWIQDEGIRKSTDLVNLHSIYAMIIISTPNWVFGVKELKC